MLKPKKLSTVCSCDELREIGDTHKKTGVWECGVFLSLINIDDILFSSFYLPTEQVIIRTTNQSNLFLSLFSLSLLPLFNLEGSEGCILFLRIWTFVRIFQFPVDRLNMNWSNCFLLVLSSAAWMICFPATVWYAYILLFLCLFMIV